MKIVVNERPATSSLLIIIGIFLINYLVIGGIIQVLIMLASGVSLGDLVASGGNMSGIQNGWLIMMISQGIVSFLAFIGTSWFYWKMVERKSWDLLCRNAFPTLAILGLTLLIQFTFMGFNGWLQELNEGMKLPESLRGLEIFLKNMEDTLAQATKAMTNFTSFGQYLLAFLVIAVIAGIGEELLFRGLIMRKLYLGTKNIHVAIVLSAIIFSAIHFQFYGFLPRMMLGIVFGYFYYWTGNLWIPILAHIFNNGLAVTIMYLNNIKVTNVDLETMDDVPSTAIVGSLIMSLGLMYYLRKMTRRNETI